MNILTKILFIILAIAVLALGFLVGTFILIFIFALLVLMTLLFIVIWLFNNIVTVFKSNLAKLAFKSIFSILVTYGIMELFWIFTSKYFIQMDKTIAICTLWVVAAIFFGALWYLLHIKHQNKKHHQYLWDEYKRDSSKLNTWDAIMMVIMPSIILYVFNAVHLII